MSAQAVFWACAAIALGGAIVVTVAREILRMIAGLGAFLLACAGLFAYFGMGFLAGAVVFVYVGGVLLLLVFAIMLVHRGPGGSTLLETRHSVGALSVAASLFIVVVSALWDVAPGSAGQGIVSGTASLAEALLGPMVAHFEIVGVLLLVVLVGVVVVAGKDDE